MTIIDTSTLQQQVDALIKAHPVFARVLEETGSYPPLRAGTPGFVGLVEIVASQQISKSAANTILARLWHKIDEAKPSPKSPPVESYTALSEEEKRACGLSRPKIKYIDGIAAACLAGKLDPEALAALDDTALLKTLTTLPGLGLWSAEIYALFILGRPDIMPAADLALQESARQLLGLSQRPDHKTLRHISDAWRPYRSAAARLLWHYYRGAAIE